MLQLEIPIEDEYWDPEKEEFIPPKKAVLQLEHSLVSISKWESKWCKPFLNSSKNMTDEEALDYIKCMTITQNVNPDVYNHITNREIDQITKYINLPMTATTINRDEEEGKKAAPRIITNELVYFWMIAHNIPIDICQKWHLNRLLMLIEVCEAERAPKKKRSKGDIMRRNAKLNEINRKKFNSKG